MRISYLLSDRSNISKCLCPLFSIVLFLNTDDVHMHKNILFMTLAGFDRLRLHLEGMIPYFSAYEHGQDFRMSLVLLLEEVIESMV